MAIQALYSTNPGAYRKASLLRLAPQSIAEPSHLCVPSVLHLSFSHFQLLIRGWIFTQLRKTKEGVQLLPLPPMPPCPWGRNPRARRRAGCLTPCSSVKGRTARSGVTRAALSELSHPARAELEEKEPRQRCLPLPRAAGSQVKSMDVLLLVVGSRGLRTFNSRGKSDS